MAAVVVSAEVVPAGIVFPELVITVLQELMAIMVPIPV